MLLIQKLHFLGYLICSHAFYHPLNATCYSYNPEFPPKLQLPIANCLQPLRLLLYEVTLCFTRTPGPILDPLLFLCYKIMVGCLPLTLYVFNYHLYATNVTPLTLTV